MTYGPHPLLEPSQWGVGPSTKMHTLDADMLIHITKIIEIRIPILYLVLIFSCSKIRPLDEKQAG